MHQLVETVGGRRGTDDDDRAAAPATFVVLASPVALLTIMNDVSSFCAPVDNLVASLFKQRYRYRAVDPVTDRR